MQRKNRIALVTGAGGELGQAMVRALAADGISIALHYRSNRTHVEALAEELSADGVANVIVQGDLSSSHGPGAVSTEVERLLGPVDILVNNAGDWVEKPLLETTDDEWDRLLNLDLRGSYLLCRAIAPGMVTRGWGRIINISSIAGLNYVPGEGLYGIAKAGINMLTKTLGVELARDGVTVNAVAPAWTLPHDEPTPLLSADYPQCQAVPDGRPGHATEVAALIRFLTSEAAAHITGQVLPIDGGLSAVFAKGR